MMTSTFPNPIFPSHSNNYKDKMCNYAEKEPQRLHSSQISLFMRNCDPLQSTGLGGHLGCAALPLAALLSLASQHCQHRSHTQSTGTSFLHEHIDSDH
ncbi:hypothetical protein VTK26DRAFT_9024 [Humicola hyalothermophila]